MPNFNRNAIIFYIFIFLIIFLIFSMVSIGFHILGAVLTIVFKFWYVFLIMGLAYYFWKKKKKGNKKQQSYRVSDNDEKTVEINDYKVK